MTHARGGGHLRGVTKAYLVFNPVSGRGEAEGDLEVIRGAFRAAGIALEVGLTSAECPADALVREAVAKGADLVVAAGGDGTVSAAAAVVAGSEVRLGVIPRGTANAFAVSLGIPTTLEAACDNLFSGVERRIDGAVCNERPMILLAGIGFEAETVKMADREAKDRWGPLAYILSGIRQLSEQELFQAEITIGRHSERIEASAVTVANAAPATSILAQGCGQVVVDDGLLEVTILAPPTGIAAVAVLADLLKSALLKSPVDRDDTARFRTQAIAISAEPPQRVVVDGEVIGKTPVNIACVPGALRVLVPAEALPSRSEAVPCE